MKHIAFDLDGVIIDALNIHQKCFIEAWNTCVPDTPIDSNLHNEHLASRNTKQKIHVLVAMRYGQGHNIETLLSVVSSLKQKLTLESIDTAKATVTWLPELIFNLRAQGRRIALVSNSIRATCIRTLSNIGILELFDTIVASDDADVTENKPSSAPYHVAATRLGHDISSFVALEDSVVGLKAAKTAGCWVYVVSEPAHDLDETIFMTWLKIVDAV